MAPSLSSSTRRRRAAAIVAVVLTCAAVLVDAAPRALAVDTSYAAVGDLQPVERIETGPGPHSALFRKPASSNKTPNAPQPVDASALPASSDPDVIAAAVAESRKGLIGRDECWNATGADNPEGWFKNRNQHCWAYRLGFFECLKSNPCTGTSPDRQTQAMANFVLVTTAQVGAKGVVGGEPDWSFISRMYVWNFREVNGCGALGCAPARVYLSGVADNAVEVVALPTNNEQSADLPTVTSASKPGKDLLERGSDFYSSTPGFRFGNLGLVVGSDATPSTPTEQRIRYRCDWTTISGHRFGPAAQAEQGCVFPTVQPTLKYTSADNWPQVRKHIKDAQAAGAPSVLNRVWRDDGSYVQNRNATRRICAAKSLEWADDEEVPSAGDCDEYPFASVYQGAAQTEGTGFFSVRRVASSDNRSQGARLLGLYQADRVMGAYYTKYGGTLGDTVVIDVR